MKKSVIALIIVLALVILVSPGIVGMLANRAVEQQTEWVTDDASEVVVRAERFDRGWFSSEGSHRVSLNESVLSDDQRMVIERFGVDPLPELLIDTHIDHGLVPVSSLGREQGSLKPGLGSAVSRLALVFPDGERRELPGAIFTDIGLKGDTRSRYALEPGSAGDLSWGDSRFTLRVLPPDGSFEFDGAIERLEMAAPEGLSSLENLAVEGTAAPGGYGFMTGAVTLVIDRMTVPSPAGPPMPMGPLTVRQATEIVDERLASRFNLDFSTGAVPGVGRVAIAADLRIDGADPAAAGRLMRDLDRVPADAAPAEILDYAGSSLMDVSAAGFNLTVDRLDLSMPNGVLATSLAIRVPETDRASFTWASMLLAAELDARVSIPSAMYDMAVLMSPEVAQAVEMGLLTKKGSVYEMDAVYRKGLLTVNGAPLPIPLGGF